MKYFLAFFCSVLFLPCLAFADVKINEVAWMGTSTSQYSEWIELYNSGSSDISLAGWKLYKAGDEALFTLSKTIKAGGYMLVERTTASAPDAVPGINDESGSFGNGGLSNSGEDLALKDDKGNVMDSLSYASGWPAGDIATKDTMQWNGTTWITAPGTPDMQNAAVADVPPPTTSGSSGSPTSTSASSSSNTSSPSKNSAGSSSGTKTTSTKSKLTVMVPKNIFQGVQNEFDATATLSDTLRTGQGYYYWNMGNGVTYMQTTLSPIMYTYPYAGTYTVSLSYYASTLSAQPALQDTANAVVTVPTATLAVVDNGSALQIINNGTKAMNIGQWPISTTQGNRALPPMTIIAAKAHITVTAQLLGLSRFQNPVLHTPDGAVVGSKK